MTSANPASASIQTNPLERGTTFTDGSIMLVRQGSSDAFVGAFYGVYVEFNFGRASVWSKMSFEPKGIFGERTQETEQRRAEYRFEKEDSERLFPSLLEKEVLDFIELHTKTRPAFIHQQMHGYCYGNRIPEGASDLYLKPYRYDSETHSIYAINEEHPIAKFTGDFSTKEFHDEDILIELSTSDRDSAAIVKAMRTGFHSGDRKKGTDYCMRRLTWLAGSYALESKTVETVDVFVLSTDMETFSQLTTKSK